MRGNPVMFVKADPNLSFGSEFSIRSVKFGSFSFVHKNFNTKNKSRFVSLSFSPVNN